ncbi:MAG: cytochrome P450 [Myxococcota bacterium]|nr:cytochrome P450 [Myxococcota bacterium]
MADAIPTGLELTALDKAFRENPYPIVAKLRERERVHYDQVFKRYVFTRHDDVMAISRDRDLWSDPRKGNPGTFSREVMGNDDEEPSMLMMDDPGHRRLRELVYRSFTPRVVEQWRSRARAVADRVIGGIDCSEFDLMEEVARPIPTVVIAELLGVDPGMHESFKRWSNDSVEVAFSPVKEEAAVRLAEKARASLDAFFEEEIRRRRSEPGEDLISQLVAAESIGDQLSVAEIISTCNLLLAAGNLTTTDLIGNGTKAFLDHPDQLAKLREQPGLMKNAVEEILRYDSPVVESGRIANADLEIGGVKIAAGESLSVSLAAANRDPDVYPEPNRFDLEREDTHHQSFGGGSHLCLGAHLARLEAQETFSALFERFPEIHAIEGRHEYAPVPSFRSLKELWVRVAR